MSISKKYVEKLFKNLETGENDKFFENVSDKVHWSVMGTHPLAGVYEKKDEFIKSTFGRLNKIVDEMKSLTTAKNGMPFNNTYCWIVEFENNIIVKVRAYVDSALVQKVIDEDE